jgi:predicted SAM-dependent methyltransferase
VALRSIIKSVAARVLPSPLYCAVAQVRRELRACHLHRIGKRKAKSYSGRRDLRLNVGCGPTTRAGWINIDLCLSLPDVLPADLRRDLPFSDSTVIMVYGEHIFEHLEYPTEAFRFLSEALRVLQPNGLLSLGVPDAELALQDYIAKDSGSFDGASSIQPDWCDTPMHCINYVFRQGNEHKYAYDFETLRSVVEKAGFRDVKRREFNADLDSEPRRIGTLYIDARKPRSRMIVVD